MSSTGFLSPQRRQSLGPELGWPGSVGREARKQAGCINSSSWQRAGFRTDTNGRPQGRMRPGRGGPRSAGGRPCPPQPSFHTLVGPWLLPVEEGQQPKTNTFIIIGGLGNRGLQGRIYKEATPCLEDDDEITSHPPVYPPLKASAQMRADQDSSRLCAC